MQTTIHVVNKSSPLACVTFDWQRFINELRPANQKTVINVDERGRTIFITPLLSYVLGYIYGIIRGFVSDWYTDHPWLSMCTVRNKVFCSKCVVAQKKGFLVLSNKLDPAFIHDGFQNWKKAREKFRQHEKSQCHSEARHKLAALNKEGVDIQLQAQKNKSQKENRELLITELSSIKFLSRQGLALRGHKEDDGNLFQLLRTRSQDNPKMETWLKTKQYISHDIVNEMITLMGNTVLRDILANVTTAKWFAVLADETRDCSNKEQLVVCIRWVDQEYEVHEEPVGLVSLPKTEANTITKVLKDVLIRCRLPLENCRGQGYDGAANMMGHLNGVASQIQKEHSAAIPIHCLAHCTNLVLQDLCRKNKVMRDALDLAREIARLIKFSSKREFHFMENQVNNQWSDDGSFSKMPSIKPICPTRWTVRTACFDALLQNYQTLQTTLAEVNQSTRDDNGVTAGGLCALMENLSTFFGLKLSHLVFSAAEQLSLTLQGKQTTVQDARTASKALQEFYKKQREDQSFNMFYSACLVEATDKTDEPQIPRYRRIPARLDEGSNPHRFADPKEYFRQQYFEVLDILIAETERRFDQKEFNLILNIEKLLIDSSNDNAAEIPQSVLDLYDKDLDFDRLRTQLKILPDFVRSVDTGLNVTTVTNVRTLSNALKTATIGQRMLSEVDKLLRIYLTIPVTTASAERTFSVLRRLKNYMRSTMSAERLNNLLLLHVHKDRTDNLDLAKIAQSFTTANERRRSYFGSFLTES